MKQSTTHATVNELNRLGITDRVIDSALRSTDPKTRQIGYGLLLGNVHAVAEYLGVGYLAAVTALCKSQYF